MMFIKHCSKCAHCNGLMSWPIEFSPEVEKSLFLCNFQVQNERFCNLFRMSEVAKLEQWCESLFPHLLMSALSVYVLCKSTHRVFCRSNYHLQSCLGKANSFWWAMHICLSRCRTFLWVVHSWRTWDVCASTWDHWFFLNRGQFGGWGEMSTT